MSKEEGDVFNIKVPFLFPTDDQNEFNQKYADYANSTRPVVTMDEIIMRNMNSHYSIQQMQVRKLIVL